VEISPVLRAIIDISILVFAAKLLSELMLRIKMPSVLGELFAGMILGPFAIGGLVIFGFQLIELNEIVFAFAEIGVILIIFAASVEMTLADFRKAGMSSFIIGAAGVIVPFILGFWISLALNVTIHAALLIGAALTATSIAITAKILEEMHQLNSREGRIIINAAIIDDLLGLAVLAIVVSILAQQTLFEVVNILSVLGSVLGFWLILLLVSAVLIPRFVHASTLMRAKGSVEAAATAACFSCAAVASVIGLSPIVGAFAAGIAIAEPKIIKRSKEYVEKINFIFAPIFFSVVGAAVNFRAFTLHSIFLLIVLVLVGMVSKFVGCGIPAMAFLKERRRGIRVGVGMIPRGEVGLIIAGVGLTSGALTQDIYAAVVGMSIITTIIAPILLKHYFRPQS